MQYGIPWCLGWIFSVYISLAWHTTSYAVLLCFIIMNSTYVTFHVIWSNKDYLIPLIPMILWKSTNFHFRFFFCYFSLMCSISSYKMQVKFIFTNTIVERITMSENQSSMNYINIVGKLNLSECIFLGL